MFLSYFTKYGFFVHREIRFNDITKIISSIARNSTSIPVSFTMKDVILINMNFSSGTIADASDLLDVVFTSLQVTEGSKESETRLQTEFCF